MIQLILKKNTDGCTFCSRTETMFELRSGSKPSVEVLLCKFCANHLGLACQSIKWGIQA